MDRYIGPYMYSLEEARQWIPSFFNYWFMHYISMLVVLDLHLDIGGSLRVLSNYIEKTIW